MSAPGLSIPENPLAKMRGNLVGAAIGLILLSIIIGVVVHFYKKSKSEPTNVKGTGETQTLLLEEISAELGQGIKGLSDMKEKDIKKGPTVQKGPGAPDVETVSLINLQPITVKQSGYIGPLSAGVFNETTFATHALKSGCRTFVFQIDYYEGSAKDAKLFPAPNEPCLLSRDDSGTLVSLNAGSILKMSTAIASTAFYKSTPANTDPVIIILHGVRTPDPIVAPKDYLAYCSKIATQLGPLIPYHLGLTTTGDYHRQALEADIFTKPFNAFEKKVIILSTFDTTLFRNVSKLNIPQYTPYNDLDFLTHARLYKEGIISNTIHTYGRIIEIDTLVGLAPDDQANWVLKNKGYFTVVLPKLMTNLPTGVVDTLINKMGINVVPLDLFSFPVADTKLTLDIWKKKIWKLKPVALIT